MDVGPSVQIIPDTQHPQAIVIMYSSDHAITVMDTTYKSDLLMHQKPFLNLNKSSICIYVGHLEFCESI